MDIRQRLNNGILVFDGALGTMLQKRGLPTGQIPELFNFSLPEVLEDIYHQYLSAGSDIICTNTFGANRFKIEGSGFTVDEIITHAVKLARGAADAFTRDCRNRMEFGSGSGTVAEHGEYDHGSCDKKYVALSLGPIGKLMEPAGDLDFEEACSVYREQLEPGIKAGADLIIIETQSDLYELKAAIVTARELTDLPLLCTVTFQENCRMLMGADPLTVVTTLQDLGIDALGVNCSLGPSQMVPIVRELLKYSRLPVIVQPNAGLPKMVDGQTVYNVGPIEYADVMEQMIREGASVVGGCCGTTPEYIKELTNRIKTINDEYDKYNVSRHDLHRESNRKKTIGDSFQRAKYRQPFVYTAASSATKTVILDDRIRVIGERINPTGKKLLKEALKAGDYTYVENEAMQQVKAGAEILDVNVGVPGIDEKAVMCEVVRRVSAVTDAPLQIDSSDPKVIEVAVRRYNGRPIINSVNGKQEVMDAIFPIAKKYGACVIALTLDEKGLPKDADERIAIAERIINEAKKYGIGRERIIVDCLTLTVSAQQQAGRDTLEAIRRVKARFGVKTTLGVSNVSFGLPNRALLNRTFLAMALEAGLDAPITDPLAEEYMDTIRAFETLACKDVDSRDYIACYGGTADKSGRVAGKADQAVGKCHGAGKSDGISDKENSAIKSDETIDKTAPKEISASDALADIIQNGYVDRAAGATRELLKHYAPLDIVETVIIPALETVGREYETGEKFLPQLIQSADAVKNAFNVLKEQMSAGGETISYGRILLATVKGDIHDIGKNIVKVLLENYGYEVLDLGKDTDIQLIVDTVKREKIQLVGLSALMTTTVVNMEATIRALREAGLPCKIAVGGAVLNAEYATDIGADFYCKDAMDGVRVANGVFKKS
ncbi:MAG: homocysteine S-methyltransferase family protein [Anaerovoracaceae bacterium]|jgi:5-methyltetrahydrofolate--homocysteine methyltransferase